MKNKELYIKAVFWTLWSALVITCVYYIVYNAQWFIGDDAIVIRHTGFGQAFLPNDPLTFNRPLGRFFPFSYLAYDVLLLFNNGAYITPQAHYILHSVFFVVFVVAVTILLLRILANQKVLYRYSLAFLSIVVFVGRVYPQYTECFSTSWCGYTIVALFLLFVFLFYEKGKWIYGIVALLCINYFCYCGETCFVLPLSMGICALLFQRKTLAVREKVFNWLLVGSALLFLTLYALLILPYIETAYDGSHGSSVGILENAYRMLCAQKLLLLAFVLFMVRIVEVVWKKKEYSLYDNLLLTAASCCLGNFILRLNWTLYYNTAAMLVIPSVLYFSMAYLKERWTVVLFVLLALLYGYKIPTTIRKNQHHRSEISGEMSFLSRKVDEGVEVLWYEPEADEYSYELELRNWKYASFNSCMGWIRHDPKFSLKRASEFTLLNNTIWLSATENRALFQEDTCLSHFGEVVFVVDDIEGYGVGIKK